MPRQPERVGSHSILPAATDVASFTQACTQLTFALFHRLAICPAIRRAVDWCAASGSVARYWRRASTSIGQRNLRRMRGKLPTISAVLASVTGSVSRSAADVTAACANRTCHGGCSAASCASSRKHCARALVTSLDDIVCPPFLVLIGRERTPNAWTALSTRAVSETHVARVHAPIASRRVQSARCNQCRAFAARSAADAKMPAPLSTSPRADASACATSRCLHCTSRSTALRAGSAGEPASISAAHARPAIACWSHRCAFAARDLASATTPAPSSSAPASMASARATSRCLHCTSPAAASHACPCR
eukprot:6335029-Prymnesium_polylepis.1